MHRLALRFRLLFAAVLLAGFFAEVNHAQTVKEKTKKPKDTQKLVDKLVGKKKKEADKKASSKKDTEEKKLTQLRQINLSGNYVDLVQPVALDPTSLIWVLHTHEAAFVLQTL